LAELDHNEHVRSERVSKWFRRVGLDLSWHNVTVVIDHWDKKLRKNFAKEIYLNSFQKVCYVFKLSFFEKNNKRDEYLIDYYCTFILSKKSKKIKKNHFFSTRPCKPCSSVANAFTSLFFL
jgi:hypothetical protein